MLPRILIVDDLFGRRVDPGPNLERQSLCAKLRLHDVTGDDPNPQRHRDPIAEAVFHRGQAPQLARIGDTVRNAPEGVMELVRSGWLDAQGGALPWALVLVDLTFYTGLVTARSERARSGQGMLTCCGQPVVLKK